MFSTTFQTISVNSAAGAIQKRKDSTTTSRRDTSAGRGIFRVHTAIIKRSLELCSLIISGLNIKSARTSKLIRYVKFTSMAGEPPYLSCKFGTLQGWSYQDSCVNTLRYHLVAWLLDYNFYKMYLGFTFHNSSFKANKKMPALFIFNLCEFFL